MYSEGLSVNTHFYFSPLFFSAHLVYALSYVIIFNLSYLILFNKIKQPTQMLANNYTYKLYFSNVTQYCHWLLWIIVGMIWLIAHFKMKRLNIFRHSEQLSELSRILSVPGRYTGNVLFFLLLFKSRFIHNHLCCNIITIQVQIPLHVDEKNVNSINLISLYECGMTPHTQ